VGADGGIVEAGVLGEEVLDGGADGVLAGGQGDGAEEGECPLLAVGELGEGAVEVVVVVGGPDGGGLFVEDFDVEAGAGEVLGGDGFGIEMERIERDFDHQDALQGAGGVVGFAGALGK